jgi:hypothetical protein
MKTLPTIFSVFTENIIKIFSNIFFHTAVVSNSIIIIVAIHSISIPTYAQWNKHLIAKDIQMATGMDVADINGDNILDVVSSAYIGNSVAWYEGPSWVRHYIDDNLNAPGDIWAADIDGDNDTDVLVELYDDGDIIWYEAPSWTRHFVDSMIEGAQNIKIVDLDADNDLDIVAACREMDQIIWYEAPSWMKHIIDDSIDYPRGLDVIYMDEDEDLDIISGGRDDGVVAWYEAPLWTKHVIGTLTLVSNVCVADINGDDTLDVAAVSRDAKVVAWYEGPLWSKHVIDDTLDGARYVEISDIDEDNDLDLIVTAYWEGSVVWYENGGGTPVTWNKQVIDGNLAGARQVRIVDMDDDADLDLVVAGEFANEIYWYENLGVGKNTAYGETVVVHPSYLSPQGDTLFVNAQVTNPESHPVSVYALIQGNETAFQDSIQLFDDGLHEDGEASDNIWGGAKLLSGLEEDAFTCELLTHDLTVGSIHRLFPAMILFTTIGPVVFENYTFDEKDTEPNPGDRLRLKLTLKNNSSIATATNIKAGLISLDPLLSVPDYSYSFDPIAAGENSNAKSYTINISEECPANTVVPIVVNISSYGYICWSDTFSITIMEPVNLEEIREPLTRIYPNPTDNILNIELRNSGKQGLEIEILDITGTLIYQKEFTFFGAHFVEQLDLSGYAKGIYLIKVKQANTVYVGKVVVK